MNYKSRIQGNKSFTLIEIVVVIGILVILMTITVSGFGLLQKESDLNSAAEEIVGVLRLSQNKTLASERESQWGVHFDDTTSPHQYTLFAGSDYASRDISLDNIRKLPESVEIFNINLAGGSEAVFDRVSGLTSQAGELSIRLINNPTKTKTIYIKSSGLVGLLDSLAPSNGRKTDSRHVHFNFGWSIQDAATLKFDFVSAGQTETIGMATFLNPSKTEFDWEGTFSVAGTDQVFQVHTHFLDAFNTFLCIHRDRNHGKTDQEVIIYIVDGGADKDIARYLADFTDTVNVGVFGGTMEVQ